MNEYVVILADGAESHERTLLARNAAAARKLAEEAHDAEVVAVRFVRALTFSCRTRAGLPPR